MAQKGAQLDQEKLCCSICLDPLTDPVTIPCGHSYCRSCIRAHWAEEETRKIYSCPQCRKTFIPRPVLMKNTMLADLVEDLKKTGLQAAPADLCYAGPEDVACDFCSGRKLKAIKSCLVCVASYCETHLQPHYDVAPLGRHKLVEPCKKLQENLCPRHDEVMKMFCRTDQQLICYLCSVDEHKGHDTVSAAAEREKKQQELDKHQKNLQQRIQGRDKDLKLLQQEVEAINGSADKAVEDSEEIFTQLIRLMEQRRSEVKQQIRSQQETEVSRVKELQEKLEQEMAELKRSHAELMKLPLTEDHNQFLHSYSSLSALTESRSRSSIQTRPLRHFEDVTAAVSELRDQLQDVLRDKWTNVSLRLTEVDVLLSDPEPKTRDKYSEHSRDITLDPNTQPLLSDVGIKMTLIKEGQSCPERRATQRLVISKPFRTLTFPEPKTRTEFLQYLQDVRFDPNTANTYLMLSEENRRATVMSEQLFYSGHPDRFTDWFQVLSVESLTGRCYWEVKFGGGGFYVGVSYKSISRAGYTYECAFGHNVKSWVLDFYKNNYSFWHNNIKTPVSGPRSSRLGVYLDHRAGLLSFYSVSETMTLLHRVRTRFTEPLYAGLGLYYVGDIAESWKPK